jgi:hypothetical protein
MKHFIAIILTALSIHCFGQKKEVKDSITINLPVQKTLSKFDEAMKKIQAEQMVYLRGVFEAHGVSLDSVKDLQVERNKFIFKTEK